LVRVRRRCGAADSGEMVKIYGVPSALGMESKFNPRNNPTEHGERGTRGGGGPSAPGTPTASPGIVRSQRETIW